MVADMNTPDELRSLDLTALVGRPLDEARASVEAAGGTVRALSRGDAMTLDYRPRRVTLVVVDGSGGAVGATGSAGSACAVVDEVIGIG